MQLLTLVEGIDKSRFDVTVAAFYKGRQFDKKFCRVADVDIVFLGKKHELDFMFLKNLIKLIKRKQFDIIQPINVSARFFAFLIAKYLKIPYIITTERNAKLIINSFGTRVYFFFEKYTNRFCTLLIANSRAGGQFAESQGVRREKIKVIYNGIYPEKLVVSDPQAIYRSFNIPVNSRIVTMVARVIDQKDPLTYVKAAQLVAEEIKDVVFLLVGDGPLLETVRKRVKANNLQSRFICVGNSHLVADFLSQTDIFVLTSNVSEGCSNALIEAMSFGVPVVATDVGGSAEIVRNGKTGFLIKPRNPERLAEKIEELLNNETLREKMSDNAVKWAKSAYSQETMVNAYENIYTKLVFNT